ncbi:MAG: ankyrin repeat domain-containing protein, partial [Waddliaceae bacterium]
AAKYGHIDVVRELIKAKADLMLQVQERTALEIADHYKYHIKTKEEDRNKYFEIAKLLAEAQVQV